MAVDRLLPTEESTDLLGLVRDLCEHELAPYAAKAEETETFPREAFRTLGKAGLLGLPYPSSTAAPSSRTRSTCRCSRRSPARGCRSASACPSTR